jgi:hypothetical protein
VAFSGPLGAHSAERVAEALRSLVADGLAEMDASGAARLPVGDAGRPARAAL